MGGRSDGGKRHFPKTGRPIAMRDALSVPGEAPRMSAVKKPISPEQMVWTVGSKEKNQYSYRTDSSIRVYVHTSAGLKWIPISRAALSGESEAWMTFLPISIPKSPRMVP